MKKKAIWISYDFGVNGPYEEFFISGSTKGAQRSVGIASRFFNTAFLTTY